MSAHDNQNKSLIRAVAVIKAFTPDKLELGSTDVCCMTGIPLTTVHRIQTTLTKERLLERNPSTGKYRVGIELYVQGSLFLRSINLHTAATPVVKELNNLTSETVNMAIFDKGYITIVLRMESKYRLRSPSYVGFTSPAYANANGKALLSELSEAEIDELYHDETLRPVTKKTIATKAELKRELEQIKKNGVAINIEEVWEGEAAVASVVRESSGEAFASLAIAVPMIRIDNTRLQKLSGLVKLGASIISYRLGYRDKSNATYTIEELRGLVGKK